MPRRVLVWDLPLRLFHWALAGLVAFSFTSGTIGGPWMDWHLRSGYAILALLAFRLLWGLVGSDTARFASFLHPPRAAIEYARDRLGGRDRHVLGHNPLGGWVVLVMLMALAFQAATGLFSDDEISTQGPLAVKVSNAVVSRMSALHSYNEWVIVALVALHVVAIAVYRFAWRVSLVPPMIHGHVTIGDDVPAPRMRHAALAGMLFALCCAAVYYLVVIYPRTPA